jgi:hypothetical protein
MLLDIVRKVAVGKLGNFINRINLLNCEILAKYKYVYTQSNPFIQSYSPTSIMVVLIS